MWVDGCRWQLGCRVHAFDLGRRVERFLGTRRVWGCVWMEKYVTWVDGSKRRAVAMRAGCAGDGGVSCESSSRNFSDMGKVREP
jgi:hypothetical protein